MGFRRRSLPFDSTAAKAYADIAAQRRAAGCAIAEADCHIAAIARAHVAARNVKDFDGCGIRLINPWNDQRTPLKLNRPFPI